MMDKWIGVLLACLVMIAMFLVVSTGYAIYSKEQRITQCEERGGVYVKRYCLDVGTINLKTGD